MNKIYKIYLHWTATSYSWKVPGHYHTVIGDKGVIHRLTPYEQPLNAHTFGRNKNSVAISLACMGGTVWKDFPPQEAQIESMCKEIVSIVKKENWPLEKLDINRIMTHAEAAANRDFAKDIAVKVSNKRPISSVQAEEYDAYARTLGMPHCNYGPTSWQDGWPGGYAERWDLAQLKPSDPMGSGGFKIRERVRELFLK